jgi:hypothetical protein
MNMLCSRVPRGRKATLRGTTVILQPVILNTQYNIYYRKNKPLSRVLFYYLFTHFLVFTTKIITQK